MGKPLYRLKDLLKENGIQERDLLQMGATDCLEFWVAVKGVTIIWFAKYLEEDRSLFNRPKKSDEPIILMDLSDEGVIYDFINFSTFGCPIFRGPVSKRWQFK